MTIGILQPGYLPWLGFFEQLYKSDIFVLYDDVQYDRGGWRNRNRIKTAQGAQWLTVPVHAKFTERTLIKDVLIDNTVDWRKQHLRAIACNYAKTPFYKDYQQLFEEAYQKEWKYLADLDIFFIKGLAGALGIKDKKITRSSDLELPADTIERLIAVCKIYNVDTFYEGQAGRDYIDIEKFKSRGITVDFQDYKHPRYRQMFGEFVPFLSAVDLLFNHGKESLDILLNQREVI